MHLAKIEPRVWKHGGSIILYLSDLGNSINFCIRHLRQTFGHSHVQVHFLVLKQMNLSLQKLNVEQKKKREEILVEAWYNHSKELEFQFKCRVGMFLLFGGIPVTYRQLSIK